MSEILAYMREALADPYIRAAAVVVVSILVARLIDWLLCRVLLLLARRTKTDLDDQVIEKLHRPIFVSVVLLGLFAAQGVLELGDAHRFFVVGALKTLGVLIWSVALFRISHLFLQGLSRATARVAWIDARTVPLLDNLGKIAVFGLAVYMLLITWDLDVKPWLASAGIVGIALGFAAKDTLANLFGGLFIVADAPYKIGDFIVLDTGERGCVTQIGLRSTRLLTRDDVEITLPNAQIANAKITNESGGPWPKARITVTVGVAYGSDVDKVRAVLMEAASRVELVTRDPAPAVRFTEFGDSALIFRLLCWIDEPVLRGRALDELNTHVYKLFAAEGIQIPFPQRDVHIKQPG